MYYANLEPPSFRHDVRMSMHKPGLGIVQPSGLVLEERDGRVTVRTSPDLATYRLLAADGTRLGDVHGLLLETVPAKGVRIANGSIRVSAPVHDLRTLEKTVLRALSGSFVVHTHTGLPRRLYPDGGSTLPVVFSADLRKAGSSAAMMLNEEEYRQRFVVGRHTRMIARGLASERWIPGTLTAHSGVSRLLPNHYLDLDTWRAVRFWPQRGEFSCDGTRGAAAELIARRLRETVVAAADERRSAMALTAGFDSRLMVAATRPVADRLDFFTFQTPRPALDPIVAKTIADRLRLRHRCLPAIPAGQAEQAAWDRAVGHAIDHPNRILHPSIKQVECDLVLSGVLGETGRSRLYRRDGGTINGQKATSDLVLGRMGIRRDPELLADIETWLGGIAWLPTSTILDLAVLELFYMPIYRPAQGALSAEIMPLADRVIQEAFIGLPPEEKGTAALFNDCIGMLWPEALDLPINAFGDHRDLLAQVQRLLRPRKVASFMRTRLASAVALGS